MGFKMRDLWMENARFLGFEMRENAIFLGGDQDTEIYATLVENFATFALFDFPKFSLIFAFFSHFSHFGLQIRSKTTETHPFRQKKQKLEQASLFPIYCSWIHQKVIYKTVGRRDLYTAGTFKCRLPRK